MTKRWTIATTIMAMALGQACLRADDADPPTDGAEQTSAETSAVSSSPTVTNAVRVEAETMTSVNYESSAAAFASGGSFASIRKPLTNGRLTSVFHGAAGAYLIIASYADESDGSSTFTLKVGSSTAATWSSSGTTGSSDPVESVFARHRVATSVTIPANAALELDVTSSGGEFGRIDYLDFVPLASLGLNDRPSNPTCIAPARPVDGAARLERVFTGLTLAAPMLIAQAPGDASRFFVVQRAGTVVSFSASNPTDATKRTVLTVPKPVGTIGEGGLLGFAFDPHFQDNGHVYFSYTTTGGPSGLRSVVARMTSTDGGATFGSYLEILGPFDQPFTNHKGGDVHFGKDGYLYLSFGDGGSAGDPSNHGQNKNLFFSKLLRIDVSLSSSSQPYRIPPTNPFAGGGGEPATFAYGFRNPFRFSIDRSTGAVWVGDVGQDQWEEVDKVSIGGNYGWNAREGKHCYKPATGCTTAGLTDPVWEYSHNSASASITGGVVYRGNEVPALDGSYVFADFVTGQVWSLSNTTGTYQVRSIDNGGGSSLVAFNEDLNGEVYAVSIAGNIYKLRPGNVTGGTIPTKLSQTGCFQATDPRLLTAGLVPYDVNSALWSDGAAKERYFAIPDGKTITVNPDGDFDFPPGTVLAKTFSLGGKRIETRLFMRHPDGVWAGYSYEWNAAETEANLLTAGLTKPVGSQQWHYPSRTECMTCHTAAAGYSLGLETAQLNRTITYPATGRIANELDTLSGLGFLSAPFGQVPASLPKYPDPRGTDAVASRARSYLQSNCSNCHRPGGPGSIIDLRYTTPFAQTGTCNVAPSAGTLGIANAKLVAPGSAATSLIVQRPSRLDAYRMPPLASSVVDTSGVSLLTSWVNGLTGCP